MRGSVGGTLVPASHYNYENCSVEFTFRPARTFLEYSRGLKSTLRGLAGKPGLLIFVTIVACTWGLFDAPAAADSDDCTGAALFKHHSGGRAEAAGGGAWHRDAGSLDDFSRRGLARSAVAPARRAGVSQSHVRLSALHHCRAGRSECRDRSHVRRPA